MQITFDPRPIYQALGETAATAPVIPEAIKEALTVIALRARKAEAANAKSVLDRPTPFTLKSFVAKPGARVGRDLESKVYVKTAMADILERLEYGGYEPSGRGIADDTITDRFGGLGRNGIKRILKRTPRSFYARMNQTAGIWQREAGSRNVRLLVSFEDRVQYDPQLGYREVAERAGLTLLDEAKKQLAKKMRNARERGARAAARAAGGAGPGRRAGT